MMKGIAICLFTAVIISIFNTALIYFRQNPSKLIISYIAGIQCEWKNITAKTVGHIYVHRWKSKSLSHCSKSYSVSDLRQLPSFPLHPSRCYPIQRLEWQGKGDSIGQKIVGYIHPPVTSRYTFSLTTDGKAELWISPNQSPSNAVRVLYVDQSIQSAQQQQQHTNSKYISKESEPQSLIANGKYYIQVLHTIAAPSAFIQIRWKYQTNNGTQSNYQVIQGDAISMPSAFNYLLPSIVDKPQEGDSRPPPRPPLIHIQGNDNYTNQFHLLPHLPRHFITDILPSSSYGNPSYVIAGQKFPRKYQRLLQLLSKVPHRVYGKFDFQTRYGDHLVHCNKQLDIQLANSIVHQWMHKLNQKDVEHQFNLVQIIGVEEKIDDRRGKRYLIDIIVQSKVNHQLWRISEYVFLPSHLNTMCQLTDFSWDPTTTVNIVVMLDERYGHTLHSLLTTFIHRLSQYSNSSRDSFFKFIIVDCDKINDHIKQTLKRYPSLGYEIIQQGPYCNYSLLTGLESVVSRIVDTESIILHYDLRLQLPDDLLDNVRKRSIRKKTFYLPIPFQQRCRQSSVVPDGAWQINRVDIIAYCVQDILRIINNKNKGQRLINHRIKHTDLATIVVKFLNEQMEQERLCHPQLLTIQK